MIIWPVATVKRLSVQDHLEGSTALLVCFISIQHITISQHVETVNKCKGHFPLSFSLLLIYHKYRPAFKVKPTVSICRHWVIKKYIY